MGQDDYVLSFEGLSMNTYTNIINQCLCNHNQEQRVKLEIRVTCFFKKRRTRVVLAFYLVPSLPPNAILYANAHANNANAVFFFSSKSYLIHPFTHPSVHPKQRERKKREKKKTDN